MATFVLFSHDGYGLGHVRRNTLIARSLLFQDPASRVVLVTGTPARPAWLRERRMTVVSVPSLVKDESGVYCSRDLSFEDALDRRAETFSRVVEENVPDAVLVDRHPYGTAGELRPGLEAARARGARVVLGLRDILDEPGTVATELAGRGWAGVDTVYDQALVYGSPALCDHEREYAIPLPLSYCGWVTSTCCRARVSPRTLVVAAGGGADGDDVVRLGVELLLERSDRQAVVVAGPFARRAVLIEGRERVGRRFRLRIEPNGCSRLFAQAGAVLQMGGYNTTFEALAAGARPIVVPRRSPRREQAIRATRLAALGLADVVDAGVAGSEIAWLLDRPRRLADGALDAAGIRLDGAEVASRHLLRAARAGVR